MKKFDLLVYIGRFQPIHKGHIATIIKALELSHKVLILVGSANQPRSLKNPWSFNERFEMIDRSFPLNMQPERFSYGILDDMPGEDEKWVKQVRDCVRLEEGNIGIIGHSKDESSFYLDLFPEWKLVEMGNVEGINATDIREEYFGLSKTYKDVADLLHPKVHEYLIEFRDTEHYKHLWREIYGYDI